jgi:hypothetical protein
MVFTCLTEHKNSAEGLAGPQIQSQTDVSDTDGFTQSWYRLVPVEELIPKNRTRPKVRMKEKGEPERVCIKSFLFASYILLLFSPVSRSCGSN